MENEKQTLSMMMFLAIFVWWISPLLFVFMTQTQLSDAGKMFIKKTLDFEVSLFIIVFLVGFIPIIRFFAVFAFWIFNLVVCINANKSIGKNELYQYPFGFGLIK